MIHWNFNGKMRNSIKKDGISKFYLLIFVCKVKVKAKEKEKVKVKVKVKVKNKKK